MRYNKKILMVATTALFTVGCIGLIGAMKYQNIKTEASDIKAKVWRGKLLQRARKK